MSRPPAAKAPAQAPRLDIDAMLTDRAVTTIVCCGSGGVGKTTTSAALALRAAELGRRTVVLTIDPARRLAQALGLVHLGNTPEPVDLGPGTPRTAGSLDAMMLDMKRTFDEVVIAHSTPEKADAILANPFYQAVSSSFAGTQEYMAMEKLGQLRDALDPDAPAGAPRPRWDLVVVDTPPSRSALDFLDAPRRLGSFLDGRFIRLLTAPARAGGRAYLKVVGAGVSMATSVLTKVLGGQLLRDVQTFVAALDTMFGGFRERADLTYARLKDAGTAFLVIAEPERDALREAAYFVDRLAEEGMPLAGLVVNRVQTVRAPSLSGSRALAAAETLEEGMSGTDDSATDGPGLDGSSARHTAADLLRLHVELAATVRRQARLTDAFAASRPSVPVVTVPTMPTDVHDLDGLRAVGDALALS